MKKQPRNQLKEKNNYPYSESLALAEYLAERAREGWVFTECREGLRSTLVFEKGQPQQLRCHVAVVRRSSPGYDYIAEGREKQEYARQCEALGWQYLGNSGSQRILLAQDENAEAPPQADGKQTLKAVFRHDSGIFLTRLLLPLLYGYPFPSNVFRGSASLFSDAEAMVFGGLWLVWMACLFWRAGGWLHWLSANKKRVKGAQPIVFRSRQDRAHTVKRDALLFGSPGLLFAALAAAAGAAQDSRLASMFSGGALLVMLCALLFFGIQKEKRAKPLVSVLLAAALAAGIVLLLGGSFYFRSYDKAPPAPLLSQDFGDSGKDSEPPLSSHGGRTFLAQSQCYYADMGHYEIRHSKYRPVFAYMRAELHLQYRWLREIPANPAWQAEKAYSNGEETIVIFEDTILIYGSTAKPSDEQIRVIVQKLAKYV